MPPDFVSLVFHVYFSHGLLVYLSTCISGGYHVKFEPYLFFTCNPRCISHVDYWSTLSGVFHMNCFTWINSVPSNVVTRDSFEHYLHGSSGLTRDQLLIFCRGFESRWVHEKIIVLIIIILLVIFHVCFRSVRGGSAGMVN